MDYLSRLIHCLRMNIVFGISVAGALLFHLIIAWQPLTRLEGFPLLYSNGPLIDDSYIFFTMSRDLVDWFSGCNPSFKLSSGFQPLIALFYCPFFHFFGEHKELPIHLALSLNAVLGFCANIVLYSLLRTIASRVIVTFLVSVWIWSPYVMNQSVNGMETTLALLLSLCAVSYYWKINHFSPVTTRGAWLFLGFIIGVGFWARVDLCLLGVALVLDQAWLAFRGNRHSSSSRVFNMLCCSVTALLVASPWIVFTIITTGNLMPISGRAVNNITNIFFKYFFKRSSIDFLDSLFLMFSYFKAEFFAFQPLSGLYSLYYYPYWQWFIVLLGVVGFLFSVQDRHIRLLLRPLWIFQAMIFLFYILIIGGFWHLNRYFYPMYTLMLFLHAATFYYLESKFKLRTWVLTLILCLLFVLYGISYTLYYQSQWSRNLPPRYFSSSLFAKDTIPPKATVGAFQSGCLSYWLDNKVVNLDGVINEQAYLHIKNKTMDMYLKNQQIDYIVEEEFLFKMWDDYLEGKLSKKYTMVYYKKEKMLPRLWSTLGIYKKKSL